MYTYALKGSMFSLLREKVETYDPYGLMRVNATQSLVAILFIFLVNAFYKIPGFDLIIFLMPILGFLIIGTTFGYYQRMYSMLIYCIACILYSFIFSLISSYLFLSVLVVGLVIFGMFLLARWRFPVLLGMIPLIQIIATVISELPYSNNLSHLWRIMFTLIILSGLSLSCMALFPKEYFFRIWLRSLYWSIHQLAERLQQIEHNNFDEKETLASHSVSLFAFTKELSFKENGFAARRIALIVTKIYLSVAALATDTIRLTHEEIQDLIIFCQQFCQGLVNRSVLSYNSKLDSQNPAFLNIQKNLQALLNVWNHLCLKM